MHEEQPDYSNHPDRKNHIDHSRNTRRADAGKKKKTASRKALSVLCVILFAMLAIMIAGTAWWENLLNQRHQLNPSRPSLSEEEYSHLWDPDPTDPSETKDPDEPTPPVVDPNEVTWNTDPKDPLGGEHIVNIMLIGQDAREGQSVQRSDSMILCTLNRDTNTLTLTSFMRDMYVQIPGHQDNRINASYAIGGMSLLDECLKVNFGVEVDGNIEINFFGFMDVINILGGIDMELTQEEADYLNRRGNWDIEDNAGQWNLTAGVNHLNGSQALAYSRIRAVGNADFGRTERQRKMLTKMVDMMKGVDVFTLNKLLYTFMDMITTDLTNAQITNLVVDIAPRLKDLTIVSQRIPEWGAFENARIRGMMVLVPDLEKCREQLEKAMVEG